MHSIQILQGYSTYTCTFQISNNYFYSKILDCKKNYPELKLIWQTHYSSVRIKKGRHKVQETSKQEPINLFKITQSSFVILHQVTVFPIALPSNIFLGDIVHILN